MANLYFTPQAAKVPLATIRSAKRTSLENSIEDGFDLLPVPEDLNQNQVGTDESTVNTLYEVTVTFLPDPLTVGYRVRFLAALTSAGAAQIRVNLTTNYDLVDNGGLILVAGSILVGQIVEAVWTGAEYQVTNPTTIVNGSNLSPTSDNAFDLGSVDFRYKNAHFGGSVITTGLKIQDTSETHQYIFAVNELTADRTVTMPLLTGDDTFVFEAHTQMLTNKTLEALSVTTVGLKIQDTSETHQYIFAVNELTADRTVTMPLLTSNDTFVFEAHTQMLTNKTLGALSGSVTITSGDLTLSEGKISVTDTDINETAFSVTSGVCFTNAVVITVDALKLGGTGLAIISNSGNTQTRSLLKIHNLQGFSVGTTLLECIQGATHSIMILNQTKSSSYIDFQGTAGASVLNPISTHSTPGVQYGWGQVEVNGSKKWIKFYEDPSA